MLHLLQTKVWAFEQRYYSQIAPVFLRALAAGTGLQGLVSFADKRRHAAYMLATDRAPGFECLVYANADGSISYEPRDENAVAIINMLGPMTKRGAESSYGTQDYIAQIEHAASNAATAAIVLNIDSPGGSADGTEEMARVVETTNTQKPVVAYGDGLIASAAYWVASPAEHIMLADTITAEVGSVGTYAMYVNERKFLEINGLDVRILRADKSTDKIALNPIEEPTESIIEEFQAIINAVNNAFLADVKRGRGARLKTDVEGSPTLTGRVYGGKEAKNLGLIDSVGTLDKAVRKARTLANKRKLLTE